MKIESNIVKENDVYDIKHVMNNVAHVITNTGKEGLLNLKTNKLFGKLSTNNVVIMDDDNMICFFSGNKKAYVYDGLEDKMIVDGWDFIGRLENDYRFNYLLFRNPNDGKCYFFDKNAYRHKAGIFNMSIDDADMFYEIYGDNYFIITKDGKKGIYRSDYLDNKYRMLINTNYDNIELLNNVIIFTQDNKKCFKYQDRKLEDNSLIGWFDEISFDKENRNYMYCRKDNLTYVYDNERQKLVLTTPEKNLKLFLSNGYDWERHNEDCYFEINDNGKVGLISGSSDSKANILLDKSYDEIKKIYYRMAIHTKKDGKHGLFVGDTKTHQTIMPTYDEIEHIEHDYYALKKDGLYDIGLVYANIKYKPTITKCTEYGWVSSKCNKHIIYYKKKDKYGLLFLEQGIVYDPEYDSIKQVGEDFTIVKKGGKKGVLYKGKQIIPEIYKDINIHVQDIPGCLFVKIVYLALQKENSCSIKKMHNYDDVMLENVGYYNSVDMFPDIMVCKDDNNTYVYDYQEESNLVKTFPGYVKIEMYNVKDEDNKERRFYSVDEEQYFYKNGSFEKVCSSKSDYHVTTYETKYGTFETKTYDKREEDRFIEYLNSMSEDEAEEYLNNLKENSYDLKTKYSRLTFRKVK